MKKPLKIILPVVAAIAIAIAVPRVEHECGTSCGAPLFVGAGILGCSDARPSDGAETRSGEDASRTAENVAAKTAARVTFVEIGSIDCIPCRMMQPVIRGIERDYADQVKIVFHDVWTPGGKADAQGYGIRVIPTQVFLDGEGKEYFRHEGFFPREEIMKVLAMKGVR
ncbi:MAG: thioredoxin [Spirochaetes bacterium]|nr:MAG: thioredoxin [Spirochaetota bacterium]